MSLRTKRQSDAILRQYIRESIVSSPRQPSSFRASPPRNARRFLTEQILSSKSYQEILVEHQVSLMLFEADDSSATVGDILAAFDDTVNDMDNAMSEFLQKIIEFAKQYAPENIKKMIEQGEEKVKSIQNYKKDAEEIIAWFKKLKDLGTALVAAFKEAKGKHPDNAKKMLQYLWTQKKDVAQGVIEHFKLLKGMYEKNETFKQCVDKVFGDAFKKTMIALVQQAIKLIPYGDKIVAAAKLVKNVADIGGKIKDLFASFKKAKASPQDKFAAFAQKIVQGPDNPQLGAIGKAIQLNDKLEATIDDKLEAKFIKAYIETLKNADPATPISKLDANKLIGDFIKKEQEGVVVQPPS